MAEAQTISTILKTLSPFKNFPESEAEKEAFNKALKEISALISEALPKELTEQKNAVEIEAVKMLNPGITDEGLERAKWEVKGYTEP